MKPEDAFERAAEYRGEAGSDEALFERMGQDLDEWNEWFIADALDTIKMAALPHEPRVGAALCAHANQAFVTGWLLGRGLLP